MLCRILAIDLHWMLGYSMETATLAAGCFWCVEAVFQQLKGVASVISGYTGGNTSNPTYNDVLTGKTGHAEACQIEYDPEQITFEDILEVFFETHDPTTLDRQGNDIGTQYRSAIFYHSDTQKDEAERFKTRIDASGTWKSPVVTEIVPFTKFYQAEDYHQNYFRNNPNQQYCRYVIRPKLEKFEKVFKLKLS
jgi:peptide-methionine (S)-S-oxide reductase